MKHTKRILAIVLTLVMLIGTVPVGAFAAIDSDNSATDVPDTTASVVSEAETDGNDEDTTVAPNSDTGTAAAPEEATDEVAESGEVEYLDATGEQQTALATDITAGDTTLTGGWYALKEHLTFEERMIMQGDVNIILCSGALLEATKGITVAGGANVTFYEGSRDAGFVRVTNPDDGLAGIGGGGEAGSGTLTINGSNFDVVGNGNGSAIGSSIYAKCDVTINGGNVSAVGNGTGAGIGNSYNASDVSKFGGTVTVNGGIVNCEGNQKSDGLGGLYETVVINGGTVTATGKGIGSGIGGLFGTKITINGGEVTATGGTNAAGIGVGGLEFSGESTITINGGTVTANAGEGAAAIGSGKYSWLGSTIAINGGQVRAIGDETTSNGIGDGNRDQSLDQYLSTVTLNWSDEANFSLYVKGKTTFAAKTELKKPLCYGAEYHSYSAETYAQGPDMPSGETLIPYAQSNVTYTSVSHGSVSGDVDLAWTGDTVTLTVTPDAGYVLDSLTVKDKNGNAVEVNNNTFVMPATDVTVTAVFEVTFYHLYVGGNKVTNENAADVLQDGTVSYNPDNHTLTLNNATIETGLIGTDEEYGIMADSTWTGIFRIKLIGENKIVNHTTSNTATAEYGVVANKEIFLSGDGSLTVSMEAADENITYIGFQPGKELYVKDSNVKVNMPGSAKAIGAKMPDIYNFFVVNCSFSIYTGDHAESYAICCGNYKQIRVADDAILEAVCENAVVNDGAQLDDTTLELETLVGTAPNRDSAVIWDKESALSTYKYMHISNRTDGYVVLLEQSERGSVSVDKYTVHNGDTITGDFQAAEGYKLYSYDVWLYDADGNLESNYTRFTYYVDDVSHEKMSINWDGGKGHYVLVEPHYKPTHRITDNTDGLLVYSLSGNLDTTEVGIEGERVYVKAVDYVSDKQARTIDRFYVKDASGNNIEVSGGDVSKSFIMPASDVTITAEVSQVKYQVTTNYNPLDDAGGIRFISSNLLAPGDICTLQETKRSDDYELTELYYETEDGTRVNLLEGSAYNPDTGIYSFRMPAQPVTVYRIYQVIDGYSRIYFSDECFEDYSIGVINLEPVNYKTIVAEGTDTTLKLVVKDERYSVKSLYYVDANGQKVDLMPNLDKKTGLFTFTMPEPDITITFTFAPSIRLVFPEVEGGAFTADIDKGFTGDTFNLTDHPEEGYKLYSFDCNVYEANGTFVAGYTQHTYYINETVYPYEIYPDVTLGRYMEIIPNYKPTHKIIDATGGDLTFALAYGYEQTDVGMVGERVYLQAKDYISGKQARTIDDITVTDAQGNVIEVSGSSTYKEFVMPDSDVTVSATVSNIKYKVSTDYNPVNDRGIVRIDNSDMLFEPGEEVVGRLETFRDYYELTDLYYEDAEGNRTDLFAENFDPATGEVRFTMPAKAVQICKKLELKSGYYTISLDADSYALEQGRVYLNNQGVHTAGDEVSLEMTMRDNQYALSSLYYIDSADNRVDLMPSYNKEDGSFTFTMPASDITLYYGFSKKNTAKFQYPNGGSICQASALAGETAYFDRGEEDFDWYLEHMNVEDTEFYYENAQGETVTLEMHWNYEAKRGEFIMPGEDVIVNVTYHPWHKVPVGTFEHGYVTADREKSSLGQLVTYTVHPDPGWYPVKVYHTLYMYDRSCHQDENDRNVWMYVDNDTLTSDETQLVVEFERDPNYHTAKFQFTYGGNLCQTSAYGGETAYYDLGEEAFDLYAEKANLEITDFFYEDAQGETVDVEMHWDYEAKRGEFIMPDEDVTIYVIYHMWHKIPVGTFEHGYITADREQACTGQLVTYTVHPDPGWYPVKVFQRTPQYYYTRSAQQDENDRNIWTYTDDDVYDSGDLELVVQFEREPGWYSVNYTASENGTVSGAKDAKAGDTVELSVQPAEGFALASLSVTDAAGNPIAVTDNTFVMPESDVTVSATFIEGSFVGASEPYIDENGAYITGNVAHFAGADGKNYAVNADGSLGEVLESVALSYFTFKLRGDDTYQIDYYTGPAIEGQLVIPKTFNGKKITAVGNNDNKPLYGENKTQFELVLNENITTVNPYAFYVLYVTKVIGDTSSLNNLGHYAFSWANSPSGYAIDLYLDYIGQISVGTGGFNHMKVTVHTSHATTLSKTGSAQSFAYDFTDAHTYGEPVWTWAEDMRSATAAFTCTDSRCKPQNEQALVSAETKDGKNIYTASVDFEGTTYTDVKTVDIAANNGVNLTLGRDITSNYYIDYTKYASAASLTYTYNSVNEREENVPVTKTVDLNNVPEELIEDGRIKLTVSQAPAQMAERAHIEILDAKGEVLETLDYSAKTYCDKIIAMEDDALADFAGSESQAAKLKTLAHSLIAYAEAAQGVFKDYETTAVTCESDAVKAQIEAATAVPQITVNNAGQITFSSVSFVCTKDARLRLFLNTDKATSTPPAPVADYGNAALKYMMKNEAKQYFVEVSGMDAVDFDKKITVTYGGSEITLSVLDFCALALKNGNTAMQTLAKTLIVYNTNAKAYFG